MFGNKTPKLVCGYFLWLKIVDVTKEMQVKHPYYYDG